ncbi:MAG: LysR family transcriptional regulator [Sporolactobacillus sp.]|uniref:DNA-binding transcriptional regulator, LysR family n=1 Tax=Sporolactobacillus nakayamae TaxID=269670 RepID=A0A1I2TLV6_9BACL|nr:MULTISPECIES: LysR family transcriptional regulator [Sporolactobacillus]MCQ2010197.1 LysR family transcriptional regulator [Sporolactobacillus sp. STSJ-5]SFG65880.1 DNA-binding transcriptional regulator, LysR family [Sporolactobacillus nakayamae]
MDIRQLRYFLAIAKEGQITRAAKKLNIEQPPLSRQLKQIEEELGVILFDRQGKGMTLTEAGAVLQVKAEAILQQMDETVTEIKELDLGIHGTLKIGSVFSCVSLLPEKIAYFREHYPQVTFKILEGDHVVLGDYLANRSIDLVVTRLPFESNYDSSNYGILRLPSDPFVMIVPTNQKWRPSNSDVHLKDLASMPLIALKSDKTVQLNEKVVNECRRLGFEPNIVCECSSVSITIALVIAGIGVTVLPKSVLSAFSVADIDLFELPDITVQSDVGIIWMKNRYLTKKARQFIELFKAKNEDEK